MRRLIYAWNYTEWGGAQIHFLALIKQARESFDVIVVLPKETDPQFLGFLKAEGISFREFVGNIDLEPKSGFMDKMRRHWVRTKSEYAMLRTIESIGAADSIVHTDLLPAQSLLALIWLCLRTHVFITLHNAQPRVPRWRWIIWKVKFGIISQFENFRVFCTNEDAARYYSRLFYLKTSRDIKITYDSINPDDINDALNSTFDRRVALQQFGISGDKFVVLTVGQFVDRKGRWTLLDAAKAVISKTNEIVFIWVSPAPPSDEDEKKLASFGLGDKFKILRSRDIGQGREDIFRFFRVADIFVLPSYVEGIPIALLEAMAIGLACVSSNVYGIPEAIENEQTGLLIEAGDSTGLTLAILRLFSDIELRRRIAQNARSYVINKFDERIAARTAVEAYNAAFAGKE